ncbi:hypothetical protein HDV00_001243 [Rhizophlyctis rosea]|nr:hypothetical protein HDV00_001243 [Rhizophlyctis rosea]
MQVQYRNDLARKGWRFLEMAIRGGDIELVTLLLDHGAGVHGGGDAALLSAAKECRMDIISLLLEAGANVTVRRNLLAEMICSDRRPAREHEHCDARMLKLFIHLGADVHYGNELALQVGARSGRADLVFILLAGGADVCVRRELLTEAVKGGSVRSYNS